MQNVHFTPREIASLLRVNESTVKRWVDRGLLPAVKTAGGHRRIRREDLAAFSKKHSANVSHSYVLRRGTKRSKTYSWKQYYSAMYHGAYSEGLRDLTSLKLAGTSIIELFETIVVPALVHIGELWKSGQLDIANEHRLTLMIREHVILMRQIIPEPAANAPIAVLACVPRENHELALHMVAGVLRHHGVRSVNLGINVPLKELVQMSRDQKASIICITRGYSNTRGTVSYVRAVARALPKNTILIGGRGWSDEDTASIMRSVKNVHPLHSLGGIKDFVKPGL